MSKWAKISSSLSYTTSIMGYIFIADVILSFFFPSLASFNLANKIYILFFFVCIFIAIAFTKLRK